LVLISQLKAGDAALPGEITLLADALIELKSVTDTTIQAPLIHLGSQTATEPFVLGTLWASLMTDLLNAILALQVTTAVGPSVGLVNAASFQALQARIPAVWAEGPNALMALLVDSLKSNLVMLFTVPSVDCIIFADMLVSFYDSYAQTGQAPNGLMATSVNTEICRGKMFDTVRKTPENYAEPAAEWAVAFGAYWLLGAFGPTGSVTVAGDVIGLGKELRDIWTITATSGGLYTAADVANAIGDALDTFTKTVIVTDTVLPLPSGSVGPLV
jgi:hypothetical protein